MNILIYISNTSLGGGTERASITFVNQLVQIAGYNIYVVTAYGNPIEKIFQIHNKVTIKYLKIEGRPLTNIYRINKGIYNAINEFSIDTLISNEVMSGFFTLPAVWLVKKKVKFIVWDHFSFNTTLGKKGREIARIILAKYSDIIVTLTQKDKELWEKKLSPKAVVVTIPNPAPFFYNENPYNINSRSIIAIGHLNKVKGFDLLIKIWSKLKTNQHVIKGWKQYIIGSGNEKRELENLIEAEGLNEYISLVPATREIEQYYCEASFIVMTSRTEGLPMTLIESQQFGLPAISFYDSEVMYGPREIISDSGFIINQFDIDEFAEKMSLLMNNPKLRKDFSKISFSNSVKFQPDVILKQWLNIL